MTTVVGTFVDASLDNLLLGDLDGSKMVLLFDALFGPIIISRD